MLWRVRAAVHSRRNERPHSHSQVGPQAKEQRRILAREPLQHLERRCGIGPGLGVRHRDLAAVGERRLHGGGVAALEHGDVVARLVEKPGSGDADHAGAEDDCAGALLLR
jgi:hypothetical protein